MNPPLLMHGARRDFHLDGHDYISLDHAGSLGVDTWSEFRVLRRDDGTLWTLIDSGVVGQFVSEPRGQLIEARSIADVVNRAVDYAESTGSDVSALCDRMEVALFDVTVGGDL